MLFINSCTCLGTCWSCSGLREFLLIIPYDKRTGPFIECVETNDRFNSSGKPIISQGIEYIRCYEYESTEYNSLASALLGFRVYGAFCAIVNKDDVGRIDYLLWMEDRYENGFRRGKLQPFRSCKTYKQ